MAVVLTIAWHVVGLNIRDYSRQTLLHICYFIGESDILLNYLLLVVCQIGLEVIITTRL